MLENNFTIANQTSIERNYLLLARVRLVVKFYIWPLLVLFGLTGNCLSILVLTRRRLIRTSTNNYLTVLAVFDSCYLILTLILNFGSHPTFSQNSIIQNILFFLRPLADFSSNTATWLIVCFTLERTLAVARPIYAKRTCSVRRSRHLICVLLVICFLITLPTYFENNFMRDSNQTNNKPLFINQTSPSDSRKSKEYLLTFHRLYLIFICIIIIWIPLTLLCICNSILIWYVHRSRRFDTDYKSSIIYESYSSSSPTKKSEASSNDSKSSICSTNGLKSSYSFHLRRHTHSYIQKRKVTIVLIFCLCVALLLWTPQSLSLTYETFIESYSEMSVKHRTILLIFNNFANLFLCINASIDFILYCFLSEKFARTCRQMLWHLCLNYKLNADQRTRMRSLDRTSFILVNPSNNLIHQQQLAAKTTNNYYTQIYAFYRQSSDHSKNKKWKKKFVRRLSTPTPNCKIDNRIFYRTLLTDPKQQKFLTVNKTQHKSMDNLSNTEDENNGSLVTSLSSNRQSRSNTITNL